MEMIVTDREREWAKKKEGGEEGSFALLPPLITSKGREQTDRPTDLSKPLSPSFFWLVVRGRRPSN